MIRTPTLADVHDMAVLHVAAWRETYVGLLPEAEIAARTVAARTAQWTGAITAGTSRIAYAPGLGFAQAGGQRDSALRNQGYTDELYAIYLLQSAQGTGLGHALFAAVRGQAPFTALVLDGNARACTFYERTGGRLLTTRHDAVGDAAILERVYGWGDPSDHET